MARGLTKKQKAILAAIAEENKRTEIVAWCDIKVPWSQDIRRALRKLQERGLVELGRYRFHLEPVTVAYKWYVPGEYEIVPDDDDWRTMMGVRLVRGES